MGGRIYTWLTAALALAVFLSAIAVVQAKHGSRKLFVELQRLERERDAIDVEWGQLQIEQSTWATHGRIESLARAKLGLRAPAAESIVLVLP